MKLSFKILAIAILSIFMMAGTSVALTYSNNITQYDKSSNTTTGWYGMQEDNEVEPGATTGQIWDLEAFFYDAGTGTGNTEELTGVGGFDFFNGVNHSTGDWNIVNKIEAGDVFLDFSGDAKFGTDVTYDPYTSGDGYYTITIDGTSPNPYGWDIVLDMDWANKTYTAYGIDPTVKGGTSVVSAYFSIMNGSNPFRYVSGGTQIGSRDVSFSSYNDVGLSDSDIGSPDVTGGTHYAFAIDLTDVFDAAKTEYNLPEDFDFYVHLTQECGNDNLIGGASRSGERVSEPSTIMLLGIALLSLSGLGRKIIRKK